MSSLALLSLFERFTDAPRGVWKLREAILDLAVRGELAESDESEETSADLLNRIEERKRKLLEEGQIRKNKPLPPITEADIPFKVPKQWVFSRLGNLCSKTGSGSTPRGGKAAYTETGIPFLRSQNVYNSGLRLNSVALIPRETHQRMNGSAVSNGDLLLNITGGSIGRCALVSPKFQEGNVSQHVAIVRPAISETGLFLHLVLKSPYFQSSILEAQTGAGREGLPKNRMDILLIPLPPLAEQKQIVAKVEEMMGLCDELEAAQVERDHQRECLNASSLHRISTAPAAAALRIAARFHFQILPRVTVRPDQIAPFRQTILDLAVRGKLVEQDEKDQSAGEILRAISQEQSELIREVKRKKAKALPDVDLDNAPFELPRNWVWARFPELGEFGRGKSKHRPRNAPELYEGGTHPLVQTGEVARATGTITEVHSYYNEVGLAQSKKWPAGTMCITIAANIAATAVLSIDACFPDSVVGFVPSAAIPSVRYFDYFMRTAKEKLEEFAPATAQKNINLGILSELLIPLPPLAEQRRIVAKVDELMVLCDRLEASLTCTQTESRRLLNAVMAELTAT